MLSALALGLGLGLFYGAEDLMATTLFGWVDTGVSCETLCPAGTFGAECSQRCRCQNKGSCDAATGVCLCDSGWRGGLCPEPCPAGTYGRGCSQRCPTCVNGRPSIVFRLSLPVFESLARSQVELGGLVLL